jgi:hypothetical protein
MRREYTQDSRLTPMVLPTGQHSDQVVLRIGGDYVYAWSPASIAAYNMDNPQACWGPQATGDAGVARQILLGRDYLMMLSAPGTDTQPAQWTLSAFSRALVSDPPTESGLLVWQPKLSDPHGIAAWQPVDGGLCYLTGDHALHWLRGNPNP